MIKRIIFDIDGTLIAGVSFIPPTENALKKLNIYSKENIEKIQKSFATYESKYDNYNKKDYLNHISECLKETVDEKFLDIFFEELKFCIPGNNEKLIKTIKILSEKYELVLLTNYFKESQINRLKNIGIDIYFQDCFGEDLIKPNRGAYLNACGKHKPSECVMIGDNLELDVYAALDNGLKAIFVNSKNILINDNDIIKVERVEDITVDLIEKWN